ncbi:MAG: cytochrome c [Alphaproteobacteria bacterium]
MKIIGTTAAFLSAAILASGALAADIRAGEKLAKQWCTNCHLIGTEQSAGGDAAPPFAAIAESAADRKDDLKAWLADPHPPMPNLSLSRFEIDDLLAYIESLGDR